MTKILPAEWEEQSGVVLAWPHEATDWKEILEDAQKVFAEIIKNILIYEKVWLATPDKEKTEKELKAFGIVSKRLFIYEMPTNDTWARDFGPISVYYPNNKPVLLDFGFNGWGLKFASNYDNQISKNLYWQKAFWPAALKTAGMILEGGSIESDGEGTLLTTSECLLSPNRNPHLSKKKIEKKLKKFLGGQRILWLDHGYLAGDDTDSHIDTLARLAPNQVILYVSCEDQNDEHYEELKKMEKQLKGFRTMNGEPYTLYPLPFPKPFYDQDKNRLPATYANFLIINQAVLLPVYQDEENDMKALAILQKAFPDRKIIPIDCRTLIEQHGSLHCVTMQVPKGISG
ncbi:MAG TPA: agmatine deiminase [Spirochaetia bacterium]|nr:MAG: agmatine deiminase [Spirochaetes bacterium GWB1_36_13]HCL56344.1 agmatine deiminase [Spirochaetia bacterium]